MKPFVDANVIVKAFTKNSDATQCRAVLRQQFVTNSLCLVEAQYALRIITNDHAFAANCIKSLFKDTGLIVPLDKNLLFEAIKRTGKNNLEEFDLIHYTTAMMHECTSIASYDRDFDGLEIERIEP